MGGSITDLIADSIADSIVDPIADLIANPTADLRGEVFAVLGLVKKEQIRSGEKQI